MNPVRMQLLLIGTMAIWGLNISAIKVLTEYMDPLLIAAYRMVLASVIINMTVVWSRRPVRLKRISRKHWLRFALCAILMVYANQLFFIGGMQSASATNGSLIMSLSPLVATGLAAIVFREPLSRLRIAGIVLGFGGVFLVVLSGADAALTAAGWGELQVFVGMVIFTAGGLFIQSLARQFSALIISAVIYSLGALMLCLHIYFSPLAVTWQTVFPAFWPVLLMVFSGVFATAVGNMIWNRAIAELGASRTTVYQYWVPVFGVGFALLLLGEAFNAWHAVGLACILVGTYLGTRKADAAMPAEHGR